MSSSRMFVLFISLVCVFFFASSTAGESIDLNHVKEFKGGDNVNKLLIVHLIAPKRTRLHIAVIHEDKILEYHRLVVGPNGVCEGKFRGTKSWGYVLPSGTQGENLDVNVFVSPLAGKGASIDFDSRKYWEGDPQGFF